MKMEEGLKLDRWGYPVNSSSDSCISTINSYYEQVLSYGRDRKVIVDAALDDEECVLANVLAAHFLASQNPSRASFHLAAAKSRLEHATSYEKLVFDAVSYLMDRDRDNEIAFNLHAKLLKEFPRDLTSLKRAQVLCFYLGRPDLSLQLVDQVLPHNQQESYIYGMLAFPLLELGRMADAESASRMGLNINKDDLWSQHNLCHVFQQECRFNDAVEFMESCSPSWSSCCSFMYTHNWWHVALCYLEGHSPFHKVLNIYDCYIWKELQRNNADSGEIYVNALGLLLRFDVRGQIGHVEDRLNTLSSLLVDKSTWYVEWLLDLLTLWALARTKEIPRAEELLMGMKFRVSSMSRKQQQLMQKGILLAEALYEYGSGNYQRVSDFLGMDFDAINYKMIGASDEQIEVFNEVWYDALLKTGQASKALEEIEKKVQQREGVPFLWRLLEKGYLMCGREDASVAAAEKAKVLEAAYFEQTV